MSKYPFGTLAVGESSTVRNVKLGAAHARLHYFRADLKRLGWSDDELPCFRLTAHNRDIEITRLPDGARVPMGRRAQTPDDRAQEARFRAGLSPYQWRAQCDFDEWRERWNTARGRGESVLPSRALLDSLLAHAPHLHTLAIELTSQPLVYRDIDSESEALAAMAQRRTASAQAAIRRGDDPHDAAFLLSLRRVTIETDPHQ